MPDTSLAESLDYAGSGAKYDKTAKKRVMSFKAVLALLFFNEFENCILSLIIGWKIVKNPDILVGKLYL